MVLKSLPLRRRYGLIGPKGPFSQVAIFKKTNQTNQRSSLALVKDVIEGAFGDGCAGAC